jgi:hypothetical protein
MAVCRLGNRFADKLSGITLSRKLDPILRQADHENVATTASSNKLELLL